MGFGNTSTQGPASWYGEDFAGNLTANGEIFDPNELTAAHLSLPFNTRVRVTNTNNGDAVVVRINDRGPYIHGRIIDLSRAAAAEIGMIRAGVADVSLEILEDEPNPNTDTNLAEHNEENNDDIANDSAPNNDPIVSEEDFEPVANIDYQATLPPPVPTIEATLVSVEQRNAAENITSNVALEITYIPSSTLMDNETETLVAAETSDTVEKPLSDTVEILNDTHFNDNAQDITEVGISEIDSSAIETANTPSATAIPSTIAIEEDNPSSPSNITADQDIEISNITENITDTVTAENIVDVTVFEDITNHTPPRELEYDLHPIEAQRQLENISVGLGQQENAVDSPRVLRNIGALNTQNIRVAVEHLQPTRYVQANPPSALESVHASPLEGLATLSSANEWQLQAVTWLSDLKVVCSGYPAGTTLAISSAQTEQIYNVTVIDMQLPHDRVMLGSEYLLAALGTDITIVD